MGDVSGEGDGMGGLPVHRGKGGVEPIQPRRVKGARIKKSVCVLVDLPKVVSIFEKKPVSFKGARQKVMVETGGSAFADVLNKVKVAGHDKVRGGGNRREEGFDLFVSGSMAVRREIDIKNTKDRAIEPMSKVEEEGFALEDLGEEGPIYVEGVKNLWGDRSGNPSFLRIIV